MFYKILCNIIFYHLPSSSINIASDCYSTFYSNTGPDSSLCTCFCASAFGLSYTSRRFSVSETSSFNILLLFNKTYLSMFFNLFISTSGSPLTNYEWSVPYNTKLKYTQAFNQADRGRTGYLDGTQARSIMVLTQLPIETLAKIW